MLGDKFNLGSLMKNAKKMQDMMERAQGELAKIEVVGESGAGAVKVTMTARYFVTRLEIDDEIIKESKEILQDLIAAAVNDATQKVEEVTKSKMMDAGKLLGAVDDEQSEE